MKKPGQKGFGHTIWYSLTKWSERNLFKIAMFAVVFGVLGALILAVTTDLSADPMEPFMRGAKVLWGVDSYNWKWRSLISETAGAQAPHNLQEFFQALAQLIANIGQDISNHWEKNPLAVVGYLMFEIGRIAGFLVFIRSMAALLDASFVTLSAQRKVRRKLKRGEDVIAVHGDSELGAALIRNLYSEGKSVTFSDDRMVKHFGGDYTGEAQGLGLTLRAPNQVIVFDSDYEAIEFLETNLSQIDSEARIYVCLDEISAEGTADTRVSLFSMAEICALLYWAEHPIYPKVDDASFAAMLAAPAPLEPKYRVVLVGSGDYVERILEQGLQTNIFNVAGGVRYDVIGDMRHWQLKHPQYKQALCVNADELHFHGGLWYEYRDLLLEADRVVLCGSSSDNVRLAAELQVEPIKLLHVRNDFGISMEAYNKYRYSKVGPEKLEVFGTLQELCTSALVLQDRAHEHGRLRDIVYSLRAPRCNECKAFDFDDMARSATWEMSDDETDAIMERRIHVMYADGGEGITRCLGCPRFQKEWNAMYDLLRRSNYATAAHDGQKFRMMRKLGIPVSREMDVHTEMMAYKGLPQKTRDALQEIEHIRWCRFYYLNGWTYGLEKDPHMRTHYDLVPYRELKRDQSKDADAYLNLCLMILSDEEQRHLEEVWLQ